MIQFRRVVGSSMAPTYVHGQLVIVSMLARPRVGHVVVAIQRNKEVIKRIVAVHNDWQLDLRGDNKEDSVDSRDLGLVPKRMVLGVVVWPRRELPK